MTKNSKFIFVLLTLCLLFSIPLFAQETTGDMEITVKDPNGAVVPNVTVTIVSSETGTTATAGFRRTITTDSSGFARVIKIPPGVYTITAAAASGFAERVVPGVQVTLGRVTPVSVDMGVANVNPNIVTVNSTDVSPIDTTETKIQTNITAETAELLPKGINFASVLKVSPATRPEPRSGQFQIDGASGSENTFVIDGVEVTNVRTGVLNANSNLPFQLVQEVQVKSSGFEAEYGGATGGVVNVVTKGGGDRFRGEFGSSFRPSGLNALGSPTLRTNPITGLAEYYPEQRDKYNEFNPTANLSGPIIKNRLWFFGSYTPQFFNRTRTITYLDEESRLPTGDVETYKFKERDEFAFLRLDAMVYSKLRLTGSYTWNPIVQEGDIPTWVSALSTLPVLPGSNPPVEGSAYLNNTGGRQNSQSVSGQAVWTITNNLIVSGRVGHYFLNEKLGTYGQGNPNVARQTCSASSTVQFPAGFGCVRGFNNGIDLVSNTLFDATKRNIFELDTTYLTSFGGRHEFKGGYQFNGIGNKVDSKTTDQLVYRYGWTVANYSGRAVQSSPNAVGAGLLRIFQTAGDVTSNNQAIYFQDKWQPWKRLTLNLGIRTEREDVPSFAEGLPGIKFNFADKLAPRLGAAFDLTGDGKTKISAFYGWFYDRFKYELPRGSFGGDLFHDFYFEILPGDTYSSLTRDLVMGGGLPVPGGACPASGTTPVFGRVRCDVDNRIPSNAGLPLTEAGGIDPDIKAFRKSEFTVTFERELNRSMVFRSRFTHNQVDHIIEDAGFPNSQASEFYIIGNPGEGLYAQTAAGFGLQALKPERKYDALEFNIERRLVDDWYVQANYTFSRLRGNYSGLSSSDEEGRLSPNVNRYFDQPQVGWTVEGGPDNGRLATDRPHVFKLYGGYRLDWDKRFGFGSNNSTDFLLFYTAQSGSLLTSTLSIEGLDPVVLTRRGDLGRTPTFTQTDFALRHRFRFGSDNRYTIVAETDILNLFNQHTVTNRTSTITLNDYAVNDPTWGLVTLGESAACDAADNQQPCLIAAYRRFQASGAPLILADAQSAGNRYELYNLANSFQAPRVVRFGFRFIF
jgi:hypothetical protein